MRDDWAACLPDHKSRLFEFAVQRWEASYAMLSVALDEALALRARGKLIGARQQAAVCADLLDRLAGPLVVALEALGEHGRHYGTLLAVLPLDPSFFRGETAQRSASWNNLLHHVLFGSRSRFFHKLRTLAATVEELAREFRVAAEDIAEGTTTQPVACWDALECLHYDLNTCLRETIMVLKSFLRALPGEELAAFQAKLEAAAQTASRGLRPRLSRAST